MTNEASNFMKVVTLESINYYTLEIKRILSKLSSSSIQRKTGMGVKWSLSTFLRQSLVLQQRMLLCHRHKEILKDQLPRMKLLRNHSDSWLQMVIKIKKQIEKKELNGEGSVTI
jgi:hypothetical protein